MPSIKIKVNGEDIEIPVPNGFSLRHQNPDCTAKNHLCSKLDGNLVCTKLILKENSHGEFELLSFEPCSKNKSGKIMEI